MLAEKYLRRRYYEGIAEGEKRAWERAEARANARWQAWYERLLTAQSGGRTFDEPPPSEAPRERTS